MSNWLGPFKTADDAIDVLRRSVAEIIGADPDTWPYHKNAPLAISAAVGLREGAIKQLRKERDALRAELDALRSDYKSLLMVYGMATAELDALKSREGEVVYRWLALDYSGFCYGSNPPDNLPNRCNLKAFYAPAEVAT